MLSEWESERPASFIPVYIRSSDSLAGRYFPEVCYLTNEGLLASHFYYLSKLLLTTHDPTLPRIGPDVKTAMEGMQDTALCYVRKMVGSAICNELVTARFTGSLAILMCESGWVWLSDCLCLLY